MSKRGFKVAAPVVKPAEPELSERSKPVSTWQLLIESPKVFWRNFVPAATVVILPTLLVQLGALLVNGFDPIDVWTAPGALLECIGGILLVLNLAISPYLLVHSLRGERVGVIQMYRRGLRFWWRIVGFAILFSVLFAGGLLLLIVPGLIVLRRYIMVPFFIVDDDIGIREAMQRSAAATKPDHWQVWLTLAALLGFAVIGWGFTKLPAPWNETGSFILPGLYYYVLGLRYRDVRRNVGLISPSIRR